MKKTADVLRSHGIPANPQKIDVLRFVLKTTAHPTADEVLVHVRREYPTISRATVYNTLNLLVHKGLLQTQRLREGLLVFDPNTERHHHFIDEQSGRVYDIPWSALRATGKSSLKGSEVRRFQVTMKGRRNKRA